jgi:hypothetical protein
MDFKNKNNAIQTDSYTTKSSDASASSDDRDDGDDGDDGDDSDNNTSETNKNYPTGGFPPIITCQKASVRGTSDDPLKREYKTVKSMVPLNEILKQRKVTPFFLTK